MSNLYFRDTSEELVDGQLAQAKRVSLEHVTADARQTKLQSLEHTTAAAAGTVTSITLPDWARGIRLSPRSAAVRFAIGEDPAAVGAGTTFATGGIAKADAWETRLIEDGTARTLRLRSATASVVVDVEVF